MSGQSFTFNGTNFSTYGLTVLRDTMIPPMRSHSPEFVGIPGGTRVFVYQGESQVYPVEFRCRVGYTGSSSEDDFMQQLESLTNALVTTDFKHLKYKHPTKNHKAIWDMEPLMFRPRGKFAVDTDIRFLVMPIMEDSTS